LTTIFTTWIESEPPLGQFQSACGTGQKFSGALEAGGLTSHLASALHQGCQEESRPWPS